MSKTKEIKTTDQISKFLLDKDNQKYHYNLYFYSRGSKTK